MSARTQADASARTALQEYRDLAHSLGVSPWPRPIIFVLGVVSAALEVLAITLVVTMLFALMAQPVEGGLMGDMVGAFRAFTGEGWSGIALAVLLLVALKGGVAQLYTRLTIRSKNELNARVMAAAHARLVDMPFPQLRSQGQGELINTTATDTWQMANAAFLLTRIAINLCMIVIFSLMIVALSWQIALMALTGGAALAFFGQLIARLAREHGVKVRRHVEALYTRLLAAVHGARLIRAFAQEEAEKHRVSQTVARLRQDAVRAESARALAQPINEVGYLALLIGIIAIAAQLQLPQGATFAAIALLYRLAPQIRELEANRVTFAGLYAPLRALAGLLRIEPSRPAARGQRTDGDDPPSPQGEGVSLREAEADGWGGRRRAFRTRAAAPPVAKQASRHPPLAGRESEGKLESIRFDGVTFQPAGAPEPLLCNVSFEIPAGRVTALLGPSGAGKTSVVNLLLGLYAPDAGAIWVGDRKLEHISSASWLTRVAAAGQDLDVIEGTIEENLRFGAPDASEADLRAAARDARALGFIESLPDGFRTWVGAFGYNLSGGQRQRLSLARALLRRPELLILDESTSAVESAIEAEILGAVLNTRDDLTILLITHRLNRAAHVDHVVRLERGEVVMEGPSTAGLFYAPREERRS